MSDDYPRLHTIDPFNYQALLYHKIAIDQNIRALNEVLPFLGISQEVVDALNPILIDMSSHLGNITTYLHQIMVDCEESGKDLIVFGESVQKELKDAIELVEEARKIANVRPPQP